MLNIYIDESGSLSKNYKNHPYFIITFVIPEDKDNMKKTIKRYVSNNLKKFRNDVKYSKMFNKEGKFKELKGSSLDFDDKIEFLEYISKYNNFKVFYIKVSNKDLNSSILEKVSMAYNYFIKLVLSKRIIPKYKNETDFFLQVDERNIRVDFLKSLEEYLNTAFLEKECNFKVEYFQSHSNSLIQVADVFSNIFYSSLYNPRYNKHIYDLKNNNIDINCFIFPLKKDN